MTDLTQVLLLEANEEAAATLEALLEALGCEVDHCIHPHDALFALTSGPPDVVMLSSPLPRVSTTAFLANLQSVETGTDLFVVALLPAGPEYDTELAELMARGLSGGLRKPISRGDLVMMLARWRQTQNPAATEAARSAESTSPATESTTAATESAAEAASGVSPAATTEPAAASDKPPAPPKGPAMTAHIDGVRRKLVIEMVLGQSVMAWTDSGPIETGSTFGASLSYRDPAPGRNRMIELNLQLKVGSCTPAEGSSHRCSLRVEDVRPAERWKQFVRVYEAANQAQDDPSGPT